MQSDVLFGKGKLASSPQKDADVFYSKSLASFGIKAKAVGSDGNKVKGDVLDYVDERPKFDYSSFSSSSEFDESSSDGDNCQKHLSQPLEDEDDSNKDVVEKKETNCSEASVSNSAESAPKSENFHDHSHTVDELCNGFEFGFDMQRCMAIDAYDGSQYNTKAIELFKHGFIDAAVPVLLFRCAAEHYGFTAAYFNLGLCFEGKNDLKQAYGCYVKAAAEKHASANYNVGCLILRNAEFFSEKCAEKCGKEEGISFIKTASELGLAQAQSLYGSLLLEDQTDDKAKEAVVLFKEAAGQNCYDGTYLLGMCYENGWGVEKDFVRAAKLYREASEGDHAEAQHNLGVFYEHGWGGLKKSETTALKWYARAIENGHQETSVDKERLERSIASGDSETILNEETADKLQMRQGLPSSSLCLDSHCEISSLEEA